MKFTHKIFTLENSQEWNAYIDKLPTDQQNVLFTPGYYQLYENLGEGEARCFVYQEGDKFALYPFLVNSVNDLGYELPNHYFDIQGAYGYNGIVTNEKEDGFLGRFAETFCEYCASENIIAEFIRFNPLLENHLLTKYIEPVFHLDNAYIDLTSDIESIFADSYNRKVRAAIRKADNYDLKFEYHFGDQISKNRLNDFIDVYHTTMNRNSAEDYYYFNHEFFEDIVKLLGPNSMFSFALRHDKVLSVELDLFDKETVIGFLGGTLKEAYTFKTNTFLRHKLVQVFKELKVKKFNLGGGISNDDSIFRYKKSFCLNVESKFYIGKKIHNQQIYNEVVSQWKIKFPESYDKSKNKLLGYRDV